MALTLLQQLLKIVTAQPKNDSIGTCLDQVRLAQRIETSAGNFEVLKSRIEFTRSSEIGRAESPAGVCAIADLSERNSRYFVGLSGHELTLSDRLSFQRELFQVQPTPAPSWLENPFTFRQRSKEWRITNLRPIFYQLGSERLSAYDELLSAGKMLSTSPGRYFDIVEFDVQDLQTMKRNAGAARILERRNLQISNSIPSIPSINFHALTFHEGSRDIYFLPDFVAVRTGRKFVMVSYQEIDCRVEDGRYITPDVPSGIQPIDFTWQFVNKDGGPDRRFSNNFQIPVIACTELDLITRSGLQIHTAFTNRKAVDRFVSALRTLHALD